MNTIYDGEWITRDLNNTLVLNLVDNDMHSYSSYEAYDLVNVLGEDIQIGLANVNDLNNLILYGVMRFKSLNYDHQYIDIPLRNLYQLFQEPNVMKVSHSEVFFPNKKKYIMDLDAFVVINGKQILNKDYAIISTLINEPSEELQKLLHITKNYGQMAMHEKFVALTNVDILNHLKEKTE